MPSALASRTPCPSATPPTATPTTAMGQVCSLRRWRRSVLLYDGGDRKSTRLNSSHSQISYAVFCLKQKTRQARAPVHTPEALHRAGSVPRRVYRDLIRRSTRLNSSHFIFTRCILSL